MPEEPSGCPEDALVRGSSGLFFLRPDEQHLDDRRGAPTGTVDLAR